VTTFYNLFRPSDAQVKRTITILKRHADGLAVICGVIGVHFLSPSVTWSVVGGIACLVLAMAVVKWCCEP